MQKRSTFTTVTPLPAGITRRLVLSTLHDHLGMIDMAPQVVNRKLIDKGPSKASPEEFHAKWYELQDRMSYLPGIKGTITYHVCFHDLKNGVQSHVYAPTGLDIKDKWTLGGNEPGEPREPQELGLNLPKDGLWLREDVDMRSNFMVAGFVKNKLLNSHKVLVDRLVEKSKLEETKEYNARLHQKTFSEGYAPTSGAPSPGFPPNYYASHQNQPQPQQQYGQYPPQHHPHAAELPAVYGRPDEKRLPELPVDDPNAYYRSSLSHATSNSRQSHQGSNQDVIRQELPG